ncbi:MAG TPA: TIGR03960 family B12-binding radical SAM protein [Eubacteriaceae bacterium]|nr:TIGR03960 family B12-binding radical SAM protein [Eubacteriaceae bacterium]
MKELLNKKKLMDQVQMPSRYTGNEVNSANKDYDEQTIRFCLAFPDLYEVGMSHLGIKILYHLLNEKEDIFCERVFAPWTDMEALLRKEEIPLFSLESKSPLSDFDFIGFTLQYEMSYTNILNMLDLGKVALFSKDRTEKDPLVVMGGPCAYNPEPIADFADLIVIGEGEEVTLELLDCYREHKKQRNSFSKEAFLREACQIQGIYVPAFYNHQKPIVEEAPEKIKKRFIQDLNEVYYPEKLIVPFLQTVHDRATVELFRGCTRGCRFCQAGMIYRPYREKDLETLKKNADQMIESTGYEEISLSSLSTTDYTHLEEFTDYLMDQYEEKRVSVGLPSLRIDNFSIELARKLQKARKTGLTFAPEAGSQRLRDVINKGVTEQELMDSVKRAFELGWGHIKLYFMIGLPTETMEDIDGIVDLAYKVVETYKQVHSDKKNKKCKVVVSTSSFVPKAFTPFQWVKQDGVAEIEKKQNYLMEKLKSKFITYNWHEPHLSMLEGLFARGDRTAGKILYHAWKKGCKFDGSKELFNWSAWQEALQEFGTTIPGFTAERKTNEVLPWDFIDIGVNKEYLMKEYEKALKEQQTDYCKYRCDQCGFNEFEEGWTCNVYSKA